MASGSRGANSIHIYADPLTQRIILTLNIRILLPEPALLALFAPWVAPENVVDLLLLVIHQLVRVPTLF